MNLLTWLLFDWYLSTEQDELLEKSIFFFLDDNVQTLLNTWRTETEYIYIPFDWLHHLDLNQQKLSLVIDK